MGAQAAKWMEEVGVGRTLGRYELLVPIAQGGMAVVWAARMKGPRGFQKIVALKSMLPALSEDPRFEEMFLAEARLASRIKHPHVCEILDLGEDDGELYLVMEWVDGESLSSLQKVVRARRRPFPIAVAARIVRSAARGLHAAHEITDDSGAPVGLVHRDVSPQNILVGYDGTVKIVDFGVAKATAKGDGLTQAGQIKGKVPYMAPEQILGRPLDRRADIFALGVVLYQLVTGKHPFRCDDENETIRTIVSPVPVVPPSDLAEGVSPALEAVILRAMEKNRDERFETMAEMARALDEILPSLGGSEADVADFVNTTIGDQGKKRRAALRDAQRLADLRCDLLRGERASRGAISTVSMLTIPLANELSPPAGTPSDPANSSCDATLVVARSRPSRPGTQRTSRGGIASVSLALLLLAGAALWFGLRWPAPSSAEPAAWAASPMSVVSAAPPPVPPNRQSAPVPEDSQSPAKAADSAPPDTPAAAVTDENAPAAGPPAASATAKRKTPDRVPVVAPAAPAAPGKTPRFVNPDF